MELKSKLEQYRAVALLESKTKDLPSFEARRVKRQLKEATVDEIEKKFDKTLNAVREEAKKIKDDETKDIKKTVETEIDEILNNSVEEDEYRRPKNQPHNLHTVDEEDVEEDEYRRPKNQPHNLHQADESEEEFETTETVRTTQDGDVVLDESDVIDADQMKLWCRQAVEVQ